VVAEGVESEGQLDTLHEWGCDEFQGFVFSPAVAADEFRALLGKGPGSPAATGDRRPGTGGAG
jgi:EAL domain-containing protein (putative c-di-GMP-specific phosphodiesterase class I)